MGELPPAQPEQKAAIRKTIEEYVDKAKDNTIARIAKEQAPAAKEEKPAETVESAPKEKKAEKEPDSSPEEHVLGYLIQNDHRDDVKKILNDVFEKLLDLKKYKEVLKTK